MSIPIDYAVRNLGRSPSRLLLSLLGSTLVVLLALTAGGFIRGMDHSLRVSSNDQNIIFMSTGSEESVERSEISQAVPSLIAMSIPGIRQRLDMPYISPEVHMQSTVQTHAEATDHPQLLTRGVTPAAWLVHSGTRISQGRLPEAGKDEIVIGKQVHQRLGVPAASLALGSSLWFHNRPWTIVGILESPGSVIESEIWCSLTDLQIASRRDGLSCVVVTFTGDGFDDADAFAKQRLDLELIAMRESDYYHKLSAFFTPIRHMVWITALLIASGGILGGFNTMYAMFASRVREIGTLQAMGFGRRTIVKSLVQESLLASLAGTLIALVIGLLLLNGMTVQFSLGAFGLRLDPPVMLLGMVVGIFMGVLGALPPAIRCLKLPITNALKAD